MGRLLVFPLLLALCAACSERPSAPSEAALRVRAADLDAREADLRRREAAAADREAAVAAREATLRRRETPEDDRIGSVAAPASGVELEGRWTLCVVYTQTSYAPFEGMELCYDVGLRQDGDRLVGRGEKALENGERLRGTRRTPIELAGRVEGDRLRVDYWEEGARRRTIGSATWTAEGPGRWRGTFRTDAAAASGPSTLRR